MRQKPKSFASFLKQRVGRLKIRFELGTSPDVLRAKFVRLRELWADDGTKLAKRRPLPYLYRTEIYVEATMHAVLQHVSAM